MLRINYRNSILSKLKKLYAIFGFVTEVITLSGNYRPISILNDSRNSLKKPLQSSAVCHPYKQMSACLTANCFHFLFLERSFLKLPTECAESLISSPTGGLFVNMFVLVRGLLLTHRPPGRRTVPLQHSWQWGDERGFCVFRMDAFIVSGSINSVC